MSRKKTETHRSQRNHIIKQISVFLHIATLQWSLNLQMIRHQKIIQVSTNQPSADIKVYLVRQSRRNQRRNVIWNVRSGQSPHVSIFVHNRHKRDNRFCSTKSVHVVCWIGTMFADDIGSGVECANQIYGSFESECRAHGIESAGQHRRNGEIENTPREKTHVQENFIESVLVETHLFVIANIKNIMFVNVYECLGCEVDG